MLAEYTQQLNFLRSRPDSLDDEECARLARQLYQQLDNWIKKNFKDQSLLSTMTGNSLRASGVESFIPSELKNFHQRRALIQAELNKYAHDAIFSRRVFGISAGIPEGSLTDIDNEAKRLCRKALLKLIR
jgi:hypothetical protein